MDWPSGEICNGNAMQQDYVRCISHKGFKSVKRLTKDWRCEVVPENIEEDSNCPRDAIYIDGKCVVLCSNDDDCNGGETCSYAGKCTEEPTRCASDKDCLRGEKCKANGKCAVPCNPRLKNNACKAGETCRNDRTCKVKITTCKNNKDCNEEGNEMCYDNECILTCINGDKCVTPCANDRSYTVACKTEENCSKDGFCLPKSKRCTNDDDCFRGEFCKDGTCVSKCRDRKDCAPEENCNNRGECEPKGRYSLLSY